jgi:hypothetical protein
MNDVFAVEKSKPNRDMLGKERTGNIKPLAYNNIIYKRRKK